MAEHWVAGKKVIKSKELIPLWERGCPGDLKMPEQIRDKSLEELEGLMAMLSQEQSGQGIEVGTRHIKDDETSESGRSGFESRQPNKSELATTSTGLILRLGG